MITTSLIVAINEKGVPGFPRTPFQFVVSGSVPSTGQRRPALPRSDTAVLSALGGLASGFGTGPGVPPLPWPLTGGRRPPDAGRLGPRVPSGPHSALRRDPPCASGKPGATDQPVRARAWA